MDDVVCTQCGSVKHEDDVDVNGVCLDCAWEDVEEELDDE